MTTLRSPARSWITAHSSPHRRMKVAEVYGAAVGDIERIIRQA
jgi:hypothetical protein